MQKTRYSQRYSHNTQNGITNGYTFITHTTHTQTYKRKHYTTLIKKKQEQKVTQPTQHTRTQYIYTADADTTGTNNRHTQLTHAKRHIQQLYVIDTQHKQNTRRSTYKHYTYRTKAQQRHTPQAIVTRRTHNAETTLTRHTNDKHITYRHRRHTENTRSQADQ